MSVFIFTNTLSFFFSSQVFHFLSSRTIQNSVPFEDADSDKYSDFPVSIVKSNQTFSKYCIASYKFLSFNKTRLNAI